MIVENYPSYWDKCDSHAKQKTKHWNKWNRWCEEFDHHWKWLNNWVGKKNYRLFIVTWNWLLIINLLSLSLYTIAFVRHFTDEEDVNDLYDKVYGKSIRWTSIVTILIVDIFHLIIGIAVINLMRFHFYLYRNGITTFEYIMKSMIIHFDALIIV